MKPPRSFHEWPQGMSPTHGGVSEKFGLVLFCQDRRRIGIFCQDRRTEADSERSMWGLIKKGLSNGSPLGETTKNMIGATWKKLPMVMWGP